MVYTDKDGKTFSTPPEAARSLYADSKTPPIATPLDAHSPDVRFTKRHRFANGNTMGGRKPAALELRAREFILKCIEGEKGVRMLVNKIFSQALKGQYRQQELLLNYILGRPTERVQIESANSHDVSFPPVVKIIADHLRLEKLERDAASAPTVVETERVEEMERILNNAVNTAPEVEVIEEKSAPKQRSNGTPTRKRTAPKKGKKKR